MHMYQTIPVAQEFHQLLAYQTSLCSYSVSHLGSAPHLMPFPVYKASPISSSTDQQSITAALVHSNLALDNPEEYNITSQDLTRLEYSYPQK